MENEGYLSCEAEELAMAPWGGADEVSLGRGRGEGAEVVSENNFNLCLNFNKEKLHSLVTERCYPSLSVLCCAESLSVLCCAVRRACLCCAESLSVLCCAESLSVLCCAVLRASCLCCAVLRACLCCAVLCCAVSLSLLCCAESLSVLCCAVLRACLCCAVQEMVRGNRYKTLHWAFVESLEPPRLVHARCPEMVSKGNLYGQVTIRMHSRQVRQHTCTPAGETAHMHPRQVRQHTCTPDSTHALPTGETAHMHSRQTLAIYDRFGRLMLGDEQVPRDVLEYIILERHLVNPFGRWRLHAKIVPSWAPPKDPIIKTVMIPGPQLKPWQDFEELNYEVPKPTAVQWHKGMGVYSECEIGTGGGVGVYSECEIGTGGWGYIASVRLGQGDGGL
ncbi:hypothetical protein JZ751_010738 [Albula glossodonta]|uniref:39S ribosomal protein L45, mitochondrial n=1 Tax=Albula glossodonta TaxID=121402 RepID=A0A8T2N780_9TELE|nr:hypothetical protein JZ751_010738 [Albula glossodonta]